MEGEPEKVDRPKNDWLRNMAGDEVFRARVEEL